MGFEDIVGGNDGGGMDDIWDDFDDILDEEDEDDIASPVDPVDSDGPFGPDATAPKKPWTSDTGEPARHRPWNSNDDGGTGKVWSSSDDGVSVWDANSDEDDGWQPAGIWENEEEECAEEEFKIPEESQQDYSGIFDDLI